MTRRWYDDLAVGVTYLGDFWRREVRY